MFALIVLSANSLPAQTSVKERAEIFEQVWATINEKYYDASFNGVDWRAMKKKYLTRLETAVSETDFYALLDQMAGELLNLKDIRSGRDRTLEEAELFLRKSIR